jgi:asparagine synthase (glutamine-hydrolysing)
MTDLLSHRGPDGDGFWNEGPAAFGHRRLAILDLTPSGSQPMLHASGRYVVTYNGEIYNYLELRRELEAAGAGFRSTGDTEVLLEAYARWGPSCVERFNGMFAFAIWDRKERVLFAARDRFGEKPFYYRLDPARGFWFSSEPKAIHETGILRPEPNRAPLFRFLAYQQTALVEDSFFEGLNQLAPAHTLTLRDGRVEQRPYWTLPQDPPPPPGSETDWVRRVGELLEDSVRLRLRSDVPVGTCLSGGLDSSTIVALVARILGAGGTAGSATRQATFTACFPGSPQDETTFAEEMIEVTGVEAHRTAPTGADLLADLPRLLRAQYAPFSGPSIHAEWKVMEIAKQKGVTVLLNGQGADEVLGGYPFYFGDLWWSLLASGRFGEARREIRAFRALHGKAAVTEVLRPALKSRAPSWILKWRGGPHLPWLSPDFQREQVVPHPPRPRDLRGSLRESQNYRMLPHILRQADRSSMAFSLEVRLPMLDHRLVEYVDALPDAMKLRDGVTKWVQREAIRGLVPERVRTRTDKVGFGLPMAEWLRGPCADAARETLGSKSFRERGFFDVDGATRCLDRLLAGDDSMAIPVWNCFLGEHWLRACIDGIGTGA